MSKTRTEMLPLGPTALTLDGVDCGYTEDTKAMIEIQDTETTAGDTGGEGGTPHDIYHKATKIRVELILDQMGFTILQKSIQGSLRTVSGADEVLTFGQVAGQKQTAQELICTPMQTGPLTEKILKVYRVVPRDAREIAYNNDQQKTKVVFEGLWDSGRTDGDRLFRIGKTSVNIDGTAPVLSSSLPVDDTTGQSAATAQLIFSKAMDPATVNGDNIEVFVATESGVQAKVAIASFTMSSNDTIVTLAYTLASATQYNIILGSGLKDAAGNRFAGSKISFTTT